jgi:hypothetical protein
MPAETIIILSGIVIAFCAFAGVLAWADAWTRTLSRQR